MGGSRLIEVAATAGLTVHLTMADLFYRTVDCEMATKYSAILFVNVVRDQARGRLGRNSRPRGRNFALNGTQGEVGVSLKKKKKKKLFFFFFL